MRFTGHHPYKKVAPHSNTFSKTAMPLGSQNVNMVRQLAERNSDSVLFGRNGPFCGIFRVFDPPYGKTRHGGCTAGLRN
jgi:hypothetical protein